MGKKAGDYGVFCYAFFGIWSNCIMSTFLYLKTQVLPFTVPFFEKSLNMGTPWLITRPTAHEAPAFNQVSFISIIHQLHSSSSFISINHQHHSSASFISIIHQQHSSASFISIIHQHHSSAEFISRIHQHHSSAEFISRIHQQNSSVEFISRTHQHHSPQKYEKSTQN